MSNSNTDRRIAIRAHLGVQRPLSRSASTLADGLLELLADAQSLPPEEEAKLLAALSQQIGGRLAALLG